LFPTKNKFSGSNGDSTTLFEFYHNMKLAQNQMRLTETEFLKMLMICTSGRANELVTQWIEAGERVAEIYFNLSLHYDKRISTETARHRLITLVAQKNTDIAKHISNIMSLATRAASAIPPGNSRTSYFNNEAIAALLRSLPPASRTTVSNLFHTLSAKARRAITFNELTRPVINLRESIDLDIRANGASGVMNGAKSEGTQKKFVKKGKPTFKKFTTYAVEASVGEQEQRPVYRNNYQSYLKPREQPQTNVYLANGGTNVQKPPQGNTGTPRYNNKPMQPRNAWM
jgi:hypothetical protein